MPFYKSPFQLGSLELDNNIFCSPLAGCSDLPFRKMVAKYRPGLFFCEMVKMDAMVRHDPGTYRLLDYETSMHPIGAQICGSHPKYARECARIVEELGFDLVDLNCGCPVDKVTKDNSGSGLLKFPDLIGEILSEMVNAVSIPVTVKIRAGWDEQSLNGPQITEIAEKAGARAIFVHGRTRKQGYKGPANWDHIRDCVEAADSIPVFGNGDIFDAESGEKMFEKTQCAGLLVSRGTFGRPWLIEDLIHYFEGATSHERSGTEIKKVFLEHISHIFAYQSERKGLLDLRRIGSWYLKKGSGAKKLKEIVVKARDLEEVLKEIESFDWDGLF